MSEILRLKWRCRRGMKELDVALSAYLEKQYEAAPVDEQALFRELLDFQDPTLYRLLTEQEKNARFRGLVQKIHHSIIS